MGVPKFPNLGLLQFCKPITLCVNLRLRWGLKQSCSLHQELSNGMWHVTCTQKIWGDSQLLMVRSQIDKLTLSLSFDHNLGFKYSNGSCKSSLEIYVRRAFQWYKKLFHPMGFHPCDYSMKIRESIGIPIPKMWAHLGVWRFIPSHIPTFLGTWNVTPRLHFWPALLQALGLVASPRLQLQHKGWHFWKHVGKTKFVQNMLHLGKKKEEWYDTKKCNYENNQMAYF